MSANCAKPLSASFNCVDGLSYRIVNTPEGQRFNPQGLRLLVGLLDSNRFSAYCIQYALKSLVSQLNTRNCGNSVLLCWTYMSLMMSFSMPASLNEVCCCKYRLWSISRPRRLECIVCDNRSLACCWAHQSQVCVAIIFMHRSYV